MPVRGFIATIEEHRPKDRIMGYSLKGVHKDDLVMQIGEYPIKREGSQGQNKTYLIALKLAQFDFYVVRGAIRHLYYCWMIFSTSWMLREWNKS